ncbi:MAG TPA: tryptophan--tRNA ligase [Alphaproteobacteria bacterium]|nr:tryptophan--tRNA ligase [Alphaproteobacteria bacterium]
MTNKLIFSGVQPTGNLHLGNYLGAIKQWVKLQNAYKSIFCVVDLHAITVPQNPVELKKSILELAAAYIACGIDPEKAIIFQQSDVKEHTELAWILGCNTPLGWLNRMTQFKEKSGKNKENAPLGLYGYPVLMAADILLYNTNLVPVGDDQKQHIELTRDIANSFNQKYGKDVFTIPEPMILSQAKRVMSLRDGTKKMSKSDESEYSRINLSDDAETIRSKFKKAQTDSIAEIYYDLENRPAISNLLTIYASLADITIEQAQAKFANFQFSNFKTELAELAVEKISPITKKFNELKNDTTELQKILDKGAQNARTIAEKTIKQVKGVVGF